MKHYSRRNLIVNGFGSLGYLFSFFLWAWLGLLYLPMLFENEHVERLFLPDPSSPAVNPPAGTETSPLMMLLALAVTVVVMVATLIVLFRTPITIARAGKQVTAKAAMSALPLITKGKTLPPAKKRRLTANLVKLIKLLLVVIPVLATGIGVFINPPLPLDIAMLVASVLAMAALLWFCLQYSAAELFHIDLAKLV